jgi:hypothetical protein
MCFIVVCTPAWPIHACTWMIVAHPQPGERGSEVVSSVLRERDGALDRTAPPSGRLIAARASRSDRQIEPDTVDHLFP